MGEPVPVSFHRPPYRPSPEAGVSGQYQKGKPEDYSSGSLVAWLIYSAMNLLISVVGVVPLALQAALNASKTSGFRSRGKRT
nr:MAG TPA: hypothetical protein [Caudoviricetes sp.]